MTKPDSNFLRYASPNERRAISREDLGFYHAVVIAAVYDFGETFDATNADGFYAPLKQCIDEHSFLSAVVRDAHGDKAYYVRAPTINLAEHITVLSQVQEGQDAREAMEKLIGKELDRPFTPSIPHWRVVVLPLDSCEVLVVFAFSHGIGDGPTGLSFHRSFLSALRAAPSSPQPSSSAAIVTTIHKPLGEPFDTPTRLPISWSFLLGPLLGAILPSFLASLLGVRASVSAVTPTTWTGTPSSFNPTTHRSGIKLRFVSSDALVNALRVTRSHEGAKLTALLQVFIVRALSRALPPSTHDTFVSQTAINMRPSVSVPPNEMGEFANGSYLVWPRVASTSPSQELSEEDWVRVREGTKKLAKAAATLTDQPIGLLRYAPSVRGWTEEKLSKDRDASFEMSNIGMVDSGIGLDGDKARMVKMIFAQPGHVISSPIAFNFVSVKGGELVYTVTWPCGALGLGKTETEELFVERVCEEDRKSVV